MRCIRANGPGAGRDAGNAGCGCARDRNGRRRARAWHSDVAVAVQVDSALSLELVYAGLEIAEADCAPRSHVTSPAVDELVLLQVLGGEEREKLPNAMKNGTTLRLWVWWGTFGMSSPVHGRPIQGPTPADQPLLHLFG